MGKSNYKIIKKLLEVQEDDESDEIFRHGFMAGLYWCLNEKKEAIKNGKNKDDI